MQYARLRLLVGVQYKILGSQTIADHGEESPLTVAEMGNQGKSQTGKRRSSYGAQQTTEDHSSA